MDTDAKQPSLPALIERLEAAKEGSRELDDEIMGVVADSPLGMTYRAKYGWRFTTFLDAALELVPPVWQGVYLSHEWTGFKRETGTHKFHVTLKRGAHSYLTREGKGASLPLSACIAALKAVEFENNQDSPPQHDKAKA